MKNKLSKKEILFNIFILLLILLFIAKLFYGTFIAMVILLPFIIPLLKKRKEQILKRKQQKLERMFKDMLVSVSDALKTGYSVENALKESYKDMISLYGEHSDICTEMRQMISRIKLNVSIEDVFQEFANRSELKNAKLFSQIFSVAKRTGGNMVEVIKSVTDNIVLNETVKEEIETEIYGKRMEHRIMMLIPFILICFVSVSSDGFLDIMYETLLGKIIMTICVFGCFVAYVWGEKITEMEI